MTTCCRQGQPTRALGGCPIGGTTVLDWPAVGPVLHRRLCICVASGRFEGTTLEKLYGITGLSAEPASPKKLLRLIRSHRATENQLHGVGDWTMREEASQVRTGNAAPVGATPGHIGVFLLRRLARRQKQGVADAIRDQRFHPPKTVKLATTRLGE